jgi:hypothetical protein
MKKHLALVALLAGCPSDPAGNPAVLWLIPRNGEQNVALGPNEPNPY